MAPNLGTRLCPLPGSSESLIAGKKVRNSDARICNDYFLPDYFLHDYMTIFYRILPIFTDFLPTTGIVATSVGVSEACQALLQGLLDDARFRRSGVARLNQELRRVDVAP